MTQTQRSRLAGINAVHMIGYDIADALEQLGFVLGLEISLELGGAIEMVFDGTLVAAGDKNQLGDARCDGLLDRILNQGLVNDREHFFGHCLGSRQKTRTKAGDWKNSFANRLHKFKFSILISGFGRVSAGGTLRPCSLGGRPKKPCPRANSKIFTTINKMAKIRIELIIMVS